MSQAYYAQNGSATIAAAGNSQGTATAVTKQVTTVTGADGTKGVRLPSAKSSTQSLPFVIRNDEAASALRVYPATGGSINGGTTNVHISVAGDNVVTFYPTGPNTWVTSVMVATVGDPGAAGVVEAEKLLSPDASLDLADFRNLSGTNLKAGKDAVAGTVTVFPTTTAKGKAVLSCTDQAGDTQVSLVVGAMAAARTLTVPDPLAAAQFLLGMQAAVARTATADGSTTGTIAAAGKIQSITVTSDDANKIIILPTPTPGTIVILYVGATGFELRSSTPASIAINGGTGANAESAIPANTTAVMYCESATSWKGFQMGSDGTLAKVEVAA